MEKKVITKTKEKPLTIKEYNAQIDKDTKKFQKLDKAGKRVMIAQDVLQQLALGKLTAEAGAYIDLKSFFRYDTEKQERYQFKDVKANYDKIKDCPVCALGACLMSVTRLNNKLTFGDIGGGLNELNNTKVSALFKGIFSPKQLLLIECAFEGGEDGERFGRRVLGVELSDMELTKVEQFHYKYNQCNNGDLYDDEACLTAILENIIENKGTFKP